MRDTPGPGQYYAESARGSGAARLWCGEAKLAHSSSKHGFGTSPRDIRRGRLGGSIGVPSPSLDVSRAGRVPLLAQSDARGLARASCRYSVDSNKANGKQYGREPWHNSSPLVVGR